MFRRSSNNLEDSLSTIWCDWRLCQVAIHQTHFRWVRDSEMPAGNCFRKKTCTLFHQDVTQSFWSKQQQARNNYHFNNNNSFWIRNSNSKQKRNHNHNHNRHTNSSRSPWARSTMFYKPRNWNGATQFSSQGFTQDAFLLRSSRGHWKRRTDRSCCYCVKEILVITYYGGFFKIFLLKGCDLSLE